MIDYFEKRANKYLLRNESFFWAFLRKKEKKIIEKLLIPNQNSKLLDLGSGAGYYSLYFKKKYDLDVVAVDSSPAMVRELSNQGVRTLLTNIEEFKIDEKFDLILAAGVFEFIENPVISMKKIFDCLEVHGRFVLLVPSSNFFGFVYKYHHFFQGCSTHIRKITEYQKIAADNGLQSSEIYYPTLISRVVCFTRHF